MEVENDEQISKFLAYFKSLWGIISLEDYMFLWFRYESKAVRTKLFVV